MDCEEESDLDGPKEVFQGSTYYHVRFTLSSSPALSAPITAVATFYGLPTVETTLANKTYFAHFAEWETLVSAAPGHIATAAGFTVKAIGGLVGAGSEKARAYVVVIGWESLELHPEFMGVEAAGAVSGKMAAQAEGVELWHVRLDGTG